MAVLSVNPGSLWLCITLLLLPEVTKQQCLVRADLVLSEYIMKLTVTSARLSMLAYEENEPDDTIKNDFTGMREGTMWIVWDVQMHKGDMNMA